MTCQQGLERVAGRHETAMGVGLCFVDQTDRKRRCRPRYLLLNLAANDSEKQVQYGAVT